MSSEWALKKIGEFCPFKYGKGLPERDRKPGVYGVISSAGLVGTHDAAYVNSPGVVIGRKGTVGSVTYSAVPFWPIDTAFYVEDQPSIRDIRFTYYLLKTLDLHLMNTDSAVPGLNRDNAHALEVRIPSLDVQKNIANFLQHIDDRITLLRETNTTLEAIAQALFKSWFVDFDPVHAKMQGRAPEGMDEATVALFPDSFEESELGDVPKGWRSGDLNTLAELNPESWSAKHHPGRVLYVDLANTKAGQIDDYIDFSFEEAPSRARRVLRCGDVIVGTVRPGNRSFARIASDVTGLTGSTGFAVLRSREVVDQALVYIAATNDEAIDRLSHLADGGAYPAVRPEVVGTTPLVIAPEAIRNSFGEIANPLFASIGANQDRMKQLASLRDTLLPRLISGQISLSEFTAETI
jgi:type I restriction enzyme S subunit